MRFLDELDLYLTEAKEKFDLFPVSFDSEDGFSFGIEKNDSESDDPIAKVKIRTLDGVPIDALGGDYDYEDVYVDVEVVGDKDDPDNVELIKWIINKFKNLGYDEQTIRIDGYDVFKKEDDIKDIDEPEEPIESNSEIDFSNYWEDDNEEDTETPEAGSEIDTDSEISSGEETGEEESDTEEEETEEETEDSEEEEK